MAKKPKKVEQSYDLSWLFVPGAADLSDDVTLGDARAWLRNRIMKGAVCPACMRHTQLYKRNMYAGVAKSLIWLKNKSGPTREWVEVQKLAPLWLIKAKAHMKLRYWGLIEQKKKGHKVWPFFS